MQPTLITTAPRTWTAGDPEPAIGTTVRTSTGHRTVHTRYELGWHPGPWNWAGLLEQGPLEEVLSDSSGDKPLTAHRDAFPVTAPHLDAPDDALLNLTDSGHPGWWQRHGDTWQPVDVRIAIQPATLPGKVEPYPYFIDADGKVGRQDHWKGKPAQLAGFQATDEIGVDLELADFLTSPHQAIDMYPVFIDAGGGMWTLTNPITSVRVEAQ